MSMNKRIINFNQKKNQNSKPYLIAEIGVNHEGSFDKAIELINLAKEGGADAAKFQSYKAETLASKNSPSYWDTNLEPTISQYELFKKYDCFDEQEYISLARHCEEIEIDFLSTPFDDKSIDFLDPIVPFFKIASADLTNIPFLRKVAQKNKPVILSTGAATLAEIDLAVKTIEEISGFPPSLMHCILCYPTSNEDANLIMIKHLKRSFPQCIIGYSDHTIPDSAMTAVVSSFMLGAEVIEKHFTFNKDLKGNDHYHAMDINDLKNLNKILDKISILLGKESIKRPIDNELLSRKNARRSIVLKKNLSANEIIKENDLTYKRPGTGISPVFWDEIIGKKVKYALQEDYILKWNDIVD